jgi:hypothetical protein
MAATSYNIHLVEQSKLRESLASLWLHILEQMPSLSNDYLLSTIHRGCARCEVLCGLADIQVFVNSGKDPVVGQGDSSVLVSAMGLGEIAKFL